MKRIYYVSLSLLFVTISVFILALIYFLISNYGLIVKKGSGTEPVTGKTSCEKLPQELKGWNWRYGTIDAKDEYPVVLLREGYKYIKQSSNDCIFGWKFILLNASQDSFDVTVDYSVVDADGFTLGSSSAEEHVRSKKFGIIKGLINITAEDSYRIGNSDWAVSTDPPSKTNTNKDRKNRFQNASEILKQHYPFFLDKDLAWLSQYPRYVVEPYGVLLSEKWEIIAETLEIRPNQRLREILEELEIERYHEPPWSEITSKETYKQLSKDDKSTLKGWLRLREEFGDYDVERGTPMNEQRDKFED